MQGNGLFEYAIVRLVPRVERGEFLNVGVVLYCRSERFLDMRHALDVERLQALAPRCDVEEVAVYLDAFRLVCQGEEEGGPIALLPQAERFRWLTANRSTVIQTSPVHPGLCDNARATLQRLFHELVLLSD